MHSPTYKRAFYLILAALLGLTVYHIRPVLMSLCATLIDFAGRLRSGEDKPIVEPENRYQTTDS